MALPIPAGEPYLRHMELHAPHVPPDDAKISNLVQDLVETRFSGKREELWVRKNHNRRSTRSTTCAVFSFESKEDLNDEVFDSVEPQYSVDSSKTPSTSNSTFTFPVIVEKRPLPLKVTPRIVRRNDASSKNSATTWSDLLLRYSGTDISQNCPRQEDLEYGANALFDETSKRWKEVFDIRACEVNYHGSFPTVPSPSCIVDDILHTMRIFYGDRLMDYLHETEFRGLLIDACSVDKLQMLPYKPAYEPRFLVVRSLKISDLQVSSIEKLPPNTRSYTFGILDSDDMICKTELRKSKSDKIVFSSELFFDDMPYDSQIRLQFFRYCMKSLSKSSFKLWDVCSRVSEKVQEPIEFDPICEATISSEQFQNGGHLNHVHEGETGSYFWITATVTFKVHSQLRFKEYLYYASNEKKAIVGWTSNRRWCELEYPYLKLWLSHEMTNEPPTKCIDLSKACSVRRARPEENPRQYSMLIEIMENFRVEYFFFAHNHEKNINLWIEVIRLVRDAIDIFSCNTPVF